MMPVQNSIPNPVARRSTSGVRIIKANGHPDIEQAVHRFRYQVYVEEMGRKQRYADDGAKTITEPLDAVSTVFAAIDGNDRVVGTLRYTSVGKCPDSEYTSFYRMNEFTPYFPGRCSFTTKLMIAPHLRRSTLATRLAITAFKLAVSAEHALNFIDCNEHLISFFKRFGYLPFPQRSIHDEYGEVQVMVLPLRDLRHLESVRSPVLSTNPDFHEDMIDAVIASLSRIHL